MSRLPALTGDELVRALQRAGFGHDRTNGSHRILVHPDGRRTSVPCHAGRTLKRGTLGGILHDVGLSIGELQKLL
jgi:predicted RNA binding protein YcfA (HicA-like mRNA interferase family)